MMCTGMTERNYINRKQAQIYIYIRDAYLNIHNHCLTNKLTDKTNSTVIAMNVCLLCGSPYVRYLLTYVSSPFKNNFLL